LHSIFHSEYNEIDIVKFHMKSVMKIQAFIKGLVTRARYVNYLKNIPKVHHYFNKSELLAFITKARFLGLKEKVKQKAYKKGGFFTGEMIGGFRHGQGTMTYKDGAFYQGSFSFGIPSGFGKFQFPDGDSYEGHWGYYFDKFEDSELSFFNLILLKSNQKNGYKWLWCKSKILQSSPRSLSMTPRNEERILQAQSKYLELKHIFEIKSKTQLKQTLADKKVFNDNSVYLGEFKDKLRDGIGKMIWQEGETYFGEWKSDQQSGWGEHSWPDSSKYLGFFFENLKEGIGFYQWFDGNSYLGEWKKNSMDGIGRYEWNDGKMYIGEWRNNNLEGFGILLFNNKPKFEGFWHNGKKHGEGVTMYSSGRQSRDLWRHGKIVKPDI